MKLFLKNIAIFLIPPFLGLVILFASEYDRQFAWNFIEGDCGGHGNWHYNRIYKNPKPINVAFIGSSSIICAINDSIVEDSFQKLAQLDFSFANFGYCRFGRNLNYTILKEILKEREVKYVVLEVRSDENHSGHPMFPYLADSKDVLKPEFFFNQHIFSDAYLAAISRIELWKQRILYNKLEFPIDQNSFGHSSYRVIANPTELEAARQRKVKREQHKEISIIRKTNMMYPRSYLAKIDQLCERNNVELLFLYTPFYGEVDQPPKELKTYQIYGEVLMPLPEVYNNKNFWADKVHINENGGIQNSYWFANAFAAYLENKEK